MKAFKAFNRDLSCNGFKYEVDKEYEHKGNIQICKEGFHACENPLHVLRYYPSTSRFCEVDVSGNIEKSKEDSKVCSSKIKIGAEITFKSLMEYGFKFIFEKIKWGEKDTPQTYGVGSAAQTHGWNSAAQTHGWNSAAQTHGWNSAAQTHGDDSAAQTHGVRSAAQTHGIYSAAQTHGVRSAAQTHGVRSAAQTHGDDSAAQTHGENSVACSTGIRGKASGIIGNWLVLVEWVEKNNEWVIKQTKTVKVDGKKIKENVFYTLKNGKFIEYKD